MDPSPWPFDQPANCATITSDLVMKAGMPITHVYHDEGDDGWQFHPGEGVAMEHAMVVGLGTIVRRDPSLLQVADLPPGWMAWREGPDAPWQRKLQYEDAPRITLDWAQVRSIEDFHDVVLPQCGSPAWHGRNLDALSDSWITGGIDTNGPPYAFDFQNVDQIRPELSAFAEEVMSIARESIDENGGRFCR